MCLASPGPGVARNGFSAKHDSQFGGRDPNPCLGDPFRCHFPCLGKLLEHPPLGKSSPCRIPRGGAHRDRVRLAPIQGLGRKRLGALVDVQRISFDPLTDLLVVMSRDWLGSVRVFSPFWASPGPGAAIVGCATSRSSMLRFSSKSGLWEGSSWPLFVFEKQRTTRHTDQRCFLLSDWFLPRFVRVFVVGKVLEPFLGFPGPELAKRSPRHSSVGRKCRLIRRCGDPIGGPFSFRLPSHKTRRQRSSVVVLPSCLAVFIRAL